MDFKGIDVRQTTTRLIFRAFIQDSAGNIVPSGYTSGRIFELQNDASLKGFDFDTQVFSTGVLSIPATGFIHQRVISGSYDTGLWTYHLPNPTGAFTTGGIYFVQVENTGASPPRQMREFQFGQAQGDGFDAFADGILKRDFVSVSGEADRSLINSARFLRNKWAISGTGLTVYKEDDSTTAWQGFLTAGTGDPIQSMDPH